MNLDDIQQFFEDRPSLSKRSIAKEIGISRQYLNYILKEQRPLTNTTAQKMKPILVKYGFQQLDYRSLIKEEANKAGTPTDKSYRPPKDGRRGYGLQKAHEAIAKIKEINPEDGLKDAGYDTVIQWIEHNR